jgi:hypothetical protein
MLAVAGAISLMATITGHKVQDKRKTRTNLFIISLADTGAGKNHARLVNDRVLIESNCGHLIGEEGISSAAGIISSIDAHRAKLFQLDEIEDLIQAIGSPKMTHLASIPATLSQMYSAAESRWKPNAYAV